MHGPSMSTLKFKELEFINSNKNNWAQSSSEHCEWHEEGISVRHC